MDFSCVAGWVVLQERDMHSLINWWSRNHIAANFLMWALVALGVAAWFKQRKEIFPEISADIVAVTVAYPNAAPEEIETGVCIPVEEAIAQVDGVKRIYSRAGENVGVTYASVRDGYKVQDVLARIKARVDSIRNFAENAEKPVIEDIPIRMQTLSIAIVADTDEKGLRAIADKVRDSIELLPEVTSVALDGVKKHEIAIEVSEDALRRHGLTFEQIAAAVRTSSLDLPGGSLRTNAGEILIRSQTRKYTAAEFGEISLLTNPDGSRLLIREVAEVTDRFEEIDLHSRFDGKPAAIINVFRSGNEDTLKVAAAVKKWIATAPQQLPEGVQLHVWNDLSMMLKGRMDLLLGDAWQGFILVYLMLSLFLRPALAFHVAVGIPIAFAGGLIFLPMVDVSINMISLFAFIVVLGIVTDDAIVVGENVHARMARGEPAKLAAPRGTYEVMVVAIFGVCTVITAFLPMLGVSGVGGKIWRNIPWVVIPTLVISLIETNFILPAHLSNLKPEKPLAEMNFLVRFIVRIQRGMSAGVERFIRRVYKPTMGLILRWRYAAVATFLAVFISIIGLIRGNWIPFEFFPKVEAEVISAKLTMPPGVPVAVTEKAIASMEAAAYQLNSAYPTSTGKPMVRHMLASIGSQPFKVGFAPSGTGSGASIGEVTIELLEASERTVVADAIVAKWRELTGPIPGAIELTFLANTSRSGNPIELLLHGNDLPRLRQATAMVKDALNAIEGVTDVNDSDRAGARELKIDILPRGEALGLRQADVARQVRQAFYGEEAQRLQRGRDEVKVMVRYPANGRNTLANLDSMMIRTRDGHEVPFREVAAAPEGSGYSGIYRSERERAIAITADIDKNVPGANANVAMAMLTADGTDPTLPVGALSRLRSEFPDVTWSVEGEQKDQRENMQDIFVGAIFALLGIYVLLAIPLRSYIQPGIVMSVIPFGMTGAVIGHVLLKTELSIMSMIGIVALCGVVVNESLVLVEFVNRHRRAGKNVVEAAIEGGAARFQAIMLTSVTSFIGVMPIVTETSIQAKFLIPCAISLAFGCLSNLVNSLVLVPCVYAILDDVKRLCFTSEKLAEWENQEKAEAAERGLAWEGSAPTSAPSLT